MTKATRIGIVLVIVSTLVVVLLFALTSCGSSCASRGGREMTKLVVIGTRVTLTQECKGAR